MADLPWYKYFPTVFDSDTALLSNQAVGGWQRLLNYMNPKKIDTIEGNWQFFARLLRCQNGETQEIIEELKEQEICDVTISLGGKVTPIVTLTSRRIFKENQKRKNNRIRKQKQRSHALVTLDVPQDVTGERLEVRGYIKNSVKSGKKTPPSPVGDSTIFMTFVFETFKEKFGLPLKIQGGKDGSLVKTLLGTYDLQTLKKLWMQFLDSTDAFILKAGKSIGVFSSQINKLISSQDNKQDWRDICG